MASDTLHKMSKNDPKQTIITTLRADGTRREWLLDNRHVINAIVEMEMYMGCKITDTQRVKL